MRQRLGGWWRSLVTVAGLVQRINVAGHHLNVARHEFDAALHREFKRRLEAERALLEAVNRIQALLPPQEAVELDWARSGHEASVMRARQFLADLDSAA